MSFWELSDGEDITKVGSKFETGGGNLEPIPDNTECVAVIDEAKIDTNRDGLRYVSLRWSVLTPVEYKNRKVFHKVWVFDQDPQAKNPVQKKDKAKKMLFVIDVNAGGRMKASGKPITDDLLQSVTSKPMQIRIMQMKRDDGSAMNWISSVGPRNSGVGTATSSEAAPPRQPTKQELDDEVPF